MNSVNKERFMYILGGFVVACAVIVIGFLFVAPLPEGNHDIVNIAVGTLLGMAVTVVGYFFGSSKSSADKNEMLSGKAKE